MIVPRRPPLIEQPDKLEARVEGNELALALLGSPLPVLEESRMSFRPSTSSLRNASPLPPYIPGNSWTRKVRGIVNLYAAGRGDVAPSVTSQQPDRSDPEHWPNIEFEFQTMVPLPAVWKPLLDLSNTVKSGEYDLREVSPERFRKLPGDKQTNLMGVLAGIAIQVAWRSVWESSYNEPTAVVINADVALLLSFLQRGKVNVFCEALLVTPPGAVDGVLRVVGKHRFVTAEAAVFVISRVIGKITTPEFSRDRVALCSDMGTLLKAYLVATDNGKEEQLGKGLGEALKQCMIGSNGDDPISGAIVGTVLGGYLKYAADITERDTSRNERMKRGSSVLWSVLGSAGFPGCGIVVEIAKALTEEAISHWGKPRSFAEMVSKAQASISFACIDNADNQLVVEAGGLGNVTKRFDSQWASQWGYWVNTCINANGFR